MNQPTGEIMKTALFGIVSLTILLVAVAAHAQQPPAAPKSAQPPMQAVKVPSTKGAPAAQPTSPTAGASSTAQATSGGSSADADAKAKIMASAPWKQVMNEYQKWLSTQAIYTPADIKRINANLAAQIQAMPAADMQDFLDQWQAKLQVLNGKDFQQAQAWLGEYMSALTDGYRNRVLKKLGLTDVANLTADQLEDSIIEIRADQLASQQSQAAFNRSRQQQVQMVQQANTLGQQAQQAAQQASAPSVQSPYRPPTSGPWNPPPAMRTPFYVNGNGQIGYLLPF